MSRSVNRRVIVLGPALLLLGMSLVACGFDAGAGRATSAAATDPGPTSGTAPPAMVAAPAGSSGSLPGVPVTTCSDTTLSFDGVDDVATVADDDALDLANDFTVEAWIKPGPMAGAGTEMDVVSHHDAKDSQGWLLRVKDGRIEIVVYGSEVLSSKSVTSGNSGTSYVVAGAWAHIAGTLQGNTLRVYYNGLLRDSQQLGFLFGRNAYSGALRLGRAAAVEDMLFQGELDDVRLSKTARYTGPTAPKPAGVLSLDDQTVAAWRFDEPGGYILVDATKRHDGSFAPDATAPARIASTCVADR